MLLGYRCELDIAIWAIQVVDWVLQGLKVYFKKLENNP